MQNTIRSHSVWDACGNIIGMIELDQNVYGAEYSCMNDIELRMYLSQWGKKYRCDSIMVLSESNRADIHAEVFEPNAGTDVIPGAISSMCGNGIRAVGALYKSKKSSAYSEFRVSTLSGVRTVIAQTGDRFTCNMGSFYDSPDVIGKYVQNNILQSSLAHVLREIETVMTSPLMDYGIGLSGDPDPNGNIDGEPHIVLIFDSAIYKNQAYALSRVAIIGNMLTKNTHIFPHEINTNVSFIKSMNTDSLELVNFTYERNLGSDSARFITKSCGTGATAIAGILNKKYGLGNNAKVRIENIGGGLEISFVDGNLYLTGHAIRIG